MQGLASRLDQTRPERGDRAARGAVAQLRGTAPNRSEGPKDGQTRTGRRAASTTRTAPKPAAKNQTGTNAARLPAAAARQGPRSAIGPLDEFGERWPSPQTAHEDFDTLVAAAAPPTGSISGVRPTPAPVRVGRKSNATTPGAGRDVPENTAVSPRRPFRAACPARPGRNWPHASTKPAPSGATGRRAARSRNSGARLPTTRTRRQPGRRGRDAGRPQQLAPTGRPAPKDQTSTSAARLPAAADRQVRLRRSGRNGDRTLRQAQGTVAKSTDKVT